MKYTKPYMICLSALVKCLDGFWDWNEHTNSVGERVPAYDGYELFKPILNKLTLETTKMIYDYWMFHLDDFLNHHKKTPKVYGWPYFDAKPRIDSYVERHILYFALEADTYLQLFNYRHFGKSVPKVIR